MKSLYVWTGVLCDYSCGMAVAIADSEEEALETFDESHVRTALSGETPQVIPMDTRKSYAWYAWGGG
jgi:hypothetical protein